MAIILKTKTGNFLCGTVKGEPTVRYNQNGKASYFFNKNQYTKGDIIPLDNIAEFISSDINLSNLFISSEYNTDYSAYMNVNRENLVSSRVLVRTLNPNDKFKGIEIIINEEATSIENAMFAFVGFYGQKYFELPNDGFSSLFHTSENLTDYILINTEYNGDDSDFSGTALKTIKYAFQKISYLYSYPSDPLSGGGISGVGGTGSGGTGGGNWSAPSDNINFPTTPTVPDIMKTGLFSAYAMTTAELQTFGDYLWNGDFFDIIQKIASDPLDSIIGLSVFPFDLSTVTSESVPLKVGNATVNDLQTVSKLQTNMKTISCGSINISHYSGNAMDYAPYTKLQIYLPYIGIRDLNINDFMNSVIKVDYAIDILTGSCCAYISTVNDGVNKVLYTFTGKMSADIPISGRNYATLIGAISTLATTGAVASTLGGALPIAGAALLSASKMVANSQPQVEHSGNFNSHLSLNLLQTPYLIITRPRQSLPQSFNSFKGYPSNITERLGNLNGYTEVEYVHMDGFPNATKEEILEIETLLKSGVIL